MRIVFVSALVLDLFGFASPARAQEDLPPKLSIMAGYSYAIDRSWLEHLPEGIVGALSWRIGERASLVGEISGNRGRYLATPFRIERWGFLGGIKLQAGGEGPQPFLQIVGGLSRQAGDVGILNGWAIQPGGGVDLWLTDRFKLRAFGDYRLFRESIENMGGAGGRTASFEHYFRAGAGLVVTIKR